ncbi:hypothetical protein [Orbus mooreae]|uniref:hypothetical protein n=1 Tax=Orbus mooreae TaxID=3074107 RepID=UPI00370DBC1C
MNDLQLLLSAQRAMLFNISPKFRMISIDIDSDRVLQVLVVISSEVDEEEKDLMYSFAGEIEGDFSEISSTNVVFIINSDDINIIPRLPKIVFSLYQ